MQIVKGWPQHGWTGSHCPFEDTAVQLASRKVAAVSGDARRVLELCRRGAEPQRRGSGSRRRSRAREREHAQRTGCHGRGFLRREKRHEAGERCQCGGHQRYPGCATEMFQTPHMHLLEAASRHERIFLAARHGASPEGLSDACITNVMRTHEQLCRQLDEPCHLLEQRRRFRADCVHSLLLRPGQEAKRSASVAECTEGRRRVCAETEGEQRRKGRGGCDEGEGIEDGRCSKEEFAEFDHGDIPWLRNHPGLG